MAQRIQHSIMQHHRAVFAVGLALALALLFFAAPGTPAAPRVQPILLQMAEEQPDAVVSVIVQKNVDDKRVEERVTALGGTVTQDLSIINAVAAEMPVKHVSALGAADGVRWVSYDAPVENTAAVTTTFTTWANAPGTIAANGFASGANMTDSALGPNGTYGSGNKVKASFAGFNAEITSGNKITKVEVVLHGFVPKLLVAKDDPKLTMVVAGKNGKIIVLNHHAFDTKVGQAAAGFVYQDITSSRSWLWGDFDKDMQLVLDQTAFTSTSVISYDAIGLRVTSSPGSDSSGGLAPTKFASTTIDTSKLANVYPFVVHAPETWNTSPYLQGQGVTVAVVDSGIRKHSDIDKRLLVTQNFNMAYHNSLDYYGHGTFVSSLIAGDGKNSKGAYFGIAPKTNLVNLRISNDQGQARESDTVASLQWILTNRTKYNIRVVNLSLNAAVWESYHTNPLSAAVEILWFNKIVVVVSAGNSGSAELFPPANDPFVITVGATNDLGTADTGDDVVASFSAYGTTEAGSAKPELVAPGTNLIAFLPEQSKTTIGVNHPGNGVNSVYFRMSGTSMSAPIVSGAVAMLLQDEPGLNPDQVKYRLMATANRNWAGYDSAKAGAGYLDIFAAVRGTTTQPANSNYPISQLLFSGSGSVNWNNVNWNNVNWNNVNWNNVNWNNVNWNNVNWNSDYWAP